MDSLRNEWHFLKIQIYSLSQISDCFVLWSLGFGFRVYISDLPHCSPNMKVLVVPGIVSTKMASRGRTDTGGPLGDFVMWADLVAALHVLGHSVQLAADLQQANSMWAFTISQSINQYFSLGILDDLFVEVKRGVLTTKAKLPIIVHAGKAYRDLIFEWKEANTWPLAQQIDNSR